MKNSSKYAPAMKIKVKKGQKIYVLFNINGAGIFVRGIPTLETLDEYKIS